jgi:predicted enzyme related to lactoylglutathione lyase
MTSCDVSFHALFILNFLQTLRRCQSFLKILGWKIQKWEGPLDYWLISTGEDREPGIDGGIARKKDRPASGVVVTARVDSVDACLKRIVTATEGVLLCRRGRYRVWGYQAHF